MQAINDIKPHHHYRVFKPGRFVSAEQFGLRTLVTTFEEHRAPVTHLVPGGADHAQWLLSGDVNGGVTWQGQWHFWWGKTWTIDLKKLKMGWKKQKKKSPKWMVVIGCEHILACLFLGFPIYTWKLSTWTLSVCRKCPQGSAFGCSGCDSIAFGIVFFGQKWNLKGSSTMSLWYHHDPKVKLWDLDALSLHCAVPAGEDTVTALSFDRTGRKALVVNSGHRLNVAWKNGCGKGLSHQKSWSPFWIDMWWT